MNKKIGLIAILAVFISLAYNNCTKVEFSELETYQKNSQFIKTSCEKLLRHTKTKAVSFPKPTKECNWNNDGNRGKLNGYFQARIEESSMVALPKNSVVCKIDLEFENQAFKFDDHFLMTVDDVVLATSYNFFPLLDNKFGLPLYNWNNIVGQKWVSTSANEGQYCLDQDQNQSDCSWPDTDRDGVISMAFSSELMQSLMARDLSNSSHEFKFITVGDNDTGDCEHSDINFNVEINYVVVDQTL